MQALACHGVDEVHAVGSSANALIVVWRDEPTGHTIEAVSCAAERLLESFPSGIGCIELTVDSPLAGAADQRRAGLLRRCGAKLSGLASVIEGTGFVAGTTRRVMSAIDQVAKHPCPLRVFGTVDEAAAWLAPLLGKPCGPRPTSVALRHAVEELRRELAARTTNLTFTAS